MSRPWRLKCSLFYFLHSAAPQQDIDVHPLYTTHYRCRRRTHAQFHLGHGKELFHCVLLRQTRTEALATHPSEGAFPIIPRRLRVHSSGFYIFHLVSSSTEALPTAPENPSACHCAAIYAQENRDGNGCCESRDRPEAPTTG